MKCNRCAEKVSINMINAESVRIYCDSCLNEFIIDYNLYRFMELNILGKEEIEKIKDESKDRQEELNKLEKEVSTLKALYEKDKMLGLVYLKVINHLLLVFRLKSYDIFRDERDYREKMVEDYQDMVKFIKDMGIE